jgi:hypothetical protein
MMHKFFQFRDMLQLVVKLQSHLDPSHFEKEKDSSKIDFVPQSDSQEKEHYLSYLKANLSHLGLSLMGTHMECRNCLWMVIALMTVKVEIKTTMRVAGNNARMLLLLRQVTGDTVPCILHCQNCCREKFLKMFLLEIFNHFAGESKLQDKFLM